MDSIIDPTNCLEIISEMVMDGCCFREECVRYASDDDRYTPAPLESEGIIPTFTGVDWTTPINKDGESLYTFALVVHG